MVLYKSDQLGIYYLDRLKLCEISKLFSTLKLTFYEMSAFELGLFYLLTLKRQEKFIADDIFLNFFNFSTKTNLDISCEFGR